MLDRCLLCWSLAAAGADANNGTEAGKFTRRLGLKISNQSATADATPASIGSQTGGACIAAW
jgi:hypothetical protein